MKRPRLNKFNNKEESLYLLCLDASSTLTVTASGVRLFEPSHRRWNSCRRRFRPNSALLPNTLRLGWCLVATLTLVLGFISSASIHLVDASKASTSGIESDVTITYLDAHHDANSQQQWDKNIRGGRVEQQRRVLKWKNKRQRRFLEEEEYEDISSDSSVESDMSSAYEKKCTIPAGKCMECTFSEQKAYEACQVTGKWQKFECILAGETATRRIEQEASSTMSSSSSADALFKMKSCKYTNFDEGFAMFELQVFCLLIGCLAFMSIRKHKRLSSSMFDRRKQQGTNVSFAMRSKSSVGNGKRSSACVLEDGDEIEFTPMTNQEKEKVPLMEIQADHMEII
uniref:Uncharacterized protein n=1 Tax=Pseudo-nitzschia australis TaxID=44445 RepID=A0A6V0CDC4_9STRA|mmetsp:Transcript_6740/g.14350  ORF Transcript_6740/g.14350 Transcript_6740/m.14350 type:complete len:341 (-) Transcript_6740:871-1893(-)